MLSNNGSCNLKILSLALFGKEVIIRVKECNSDYAQKNGVEIRGRLISRVWGEELINDSEKRNTVVAITISTGSQELIVPANEIAEITEIKKTDHSAPSNEIISNGL